MDEHRLNAFKGVFVAITALVLGGVAGGRGEVHPSNPDGSTTVEFSASEISKILQQSPLPAPPDDATNAFGSSQAAAHLGQFLFFDPRLSASGTLSCATCHRPDSGWSDGKPLSEGAGRGLRRTPSLWNVAFNRWYFWDGRADTLWSQALKPLEGRTEMNGSRVRVASLIRTDPSLRLAYTRVFGALPEPPRLQEVPPSARPKSQDPTDPDPVAWNQLPKPDQENINPAPKVGTSDAATQVAAKMR